MSPPEFAKLDNPVAARYYSSSQGQPLNQIRSDYVLVTMEFQRLSLHERQVLTTIRLQFGRGVISRLVDKAKSRYIGTPTGKVQLSYTVQGQEPLADQLVKLSVEDILLFKPQTVEFPLRDVLRGEAQAQVNIPVTGRPELFPRDAYGNQVTVGPVNLPSGLVLSQPYFSAGPSDLNILPVYVLADSITEMASLSVSYQVRRINDAQYFATVPFKIVRSDGTQAFVWPLTLVPLFLGLVILHLALLSQRSSEDVVQPLVVAIAAAIFTILPLRSVLVPGEIAGQTNVDFLLGAEILLLLGVALFIYTRHLIQATQKPASSLAASVPPAQAHPGKAARGKTP